MTLVDTPSAARQSGTDAAYVYMNHPDIYSVQVFDCTAAGQAPAFADVVAQVTEAAARIPVLGTKLAADPLNLDLPYRVRDDAPLATRISDTDAAGESWTHCMDRYVAPLLRRNVDPFDGLWRLHVIRNVSGAPHSSGPATIAVLQIAHCAADGKGAAGLLRSLVSPVGSGASEGWGMLPTPPTVKHSLLGVVRNIAVLPSLAQSLVTMWRLDRRARQDAPPLECPVEEPSAPAMPALDGPAAVRVFSVPLAALRGRGTTVTVAVLAAISVALKQYFAESGIDSPSFSCNVPVSVPSEFAPGAANRIASSRMDLHLDVDDLAERTAKIAEGLSRVHEGAVGVVGRANARLTTVVPAPILRRYLSRALQGTEGNPVLARIVKVASYTAGAPDTALAGAPVLFAASVPAVGFGLQLAHNAIGMGDVVGIAVTATPSVIADIDRYTEILRHALEQAPALDG